MVDRDVLNQASALHNKGNNRDSPPLQAGGFEASALTTATPPQWPWHGVQRQPLPILWHEHLFPFARFRWLFFPPLGVAASFPKFGLVLPALAHRP